MRGILQGMGLTLSHLGRPKVTRLYPYEKPRLPARSRGLIELIQEDGQATPFNLKCEACLLCEKACPPRAITIEYRPTYRFRKRPYFSERAKAGYYTPRISEYAVDYPNRPQAAVVRTPTTVALEAPVDLAKVDAILADASLEGYALTDLLDRVMQAYGGLPLAVAQRIVQARGIDLSDLFGIATMSPHFAPAKPKTPHVLRDDLPPRGPSAATRGKYADINHRRGPNA
jgi:ferredoxin